VDCETNYYQAFDGFDGSIDPMPSCQSCPSGGRCKDNKFLKNLAASSWTKVAETLFGKTNVLWRVAECPAGFSLERTVFNPAGDTCVECPDGKYSIAGSKWAGNNTAPEDFCIRCPAEGADCKVLFLSSQHNTPSFLLKVFVGLVRET
jgi:hypothetical protein